MEVRKFNQLDSLRFFAVFLVVCIHWGGWFGCGFFETLASGSRGVDLFFVISGFLITLGLLRSRDRDQSTGTSLYKFYVRRFLRIFPIYYLFLLLLWFVDHGRVAKGIWWYVFYASNFYSIKIQDWGGLGHLWSLAVEEQFYLVWPFIILLTSTRWLPHVMIGAVLISWATKIMWFAQGQTFWIWYMHPIGCLDTLALGSLLSYLYYFHQDRLRTALHNPYLAIIIFIQLLVCGYAQFTPYNAFYHTSMRVCFGIFSAWLIGRTVFGFTGVVGYILDNRVLRYIGKVSYCIYLIHILIPNLFVSFKLIEEPNLRFLMYAALTIAIASFSWYVIEKPLLKLKDRFE